MTVQQNETVQPTMENVVSCMCTLLAWVSRDTKTPHLNAAEDRELMHFVRVLSNHPSPVDISQAIRFVNYLADTFGDPVPVASGEQEPNK